MLRRQILHAGAAVSALATLPAFAQERWPARPITYIVPFPTGGATDILARQIGQKLGPALGTTVVVENRSGAAGSVGTTAAARAAADGYTLVGGTISSHAINVSLYANLGYDPVKSFAPVVLTGTSPVVLVVAQNSPFKSLADILAAAKAAPGTVSGASSGHGSSQHMALELLGHMAGVKFNHIPYRGSAPAMTDLMGGQVQLMFDTPVVAMPHITGGKVRALAVSTASRLPSLPDVPTVAEAGVQGFEVTSWHGVFAPAGTPAPIVQRLHDEILKILQTRDMQERLNALGMTSAPMSVAQFTAFQQAEVRKWRDVVQAAGIKAE